MKDFELLVSLNVFNESLMNDAVYKFKRYEDASLSYTGIDRHAGEQIGLYSTVVSKEDYDTMAGLLSESMKADGKAYTTPQHTSTKTVNAVSQTQRDVKVTIDRKPAPTYRPAFVPPKVHTQTNPKAVEVDISNIAVGTKVKHKAFGAGIITDKGQAYIFVKFDGQSVPKKFQFPGAFTQGFLTEV